MMNHKKILSIYDFDDTLFVSGACVIVTKKCGRKQSLSTKEYSKYRQCEGDILDFSEFDMYPPKPTEIFEIIERLRSDVTFLGIDNVVVITARANKSPVEKVLENFNVPMVKVFAVGSSKSQAKSDAVFSLLENKNYQYVKLHEDNKENIIQIHRTVDSILGSNSFEAYKVNYKKHKITITKFKV